MVLIALLSARAGVWDGSSPATPAALVDFGSQSLLEYQVRLAAGAGAETILIQTDGPSPELALIVQRLERECDCTVALVQGMPAVGRALTPENRVLLLAEGLVLPAEAIDAVLEGAEERILALPSSPATAAFERIDGTTMWAGALTVSGERVLSTLDMLGEWDLALTVLRRAVQDGVRRVDLPSDLVTDSRLIFVTDQMNADAALAALSDQGHAAALERSGTIGNLLAPVSRGIVRELVRRQVEPAHLALIALVLTAAALALGLGGWTLAALLAMLPALGLGGLAEQCAQVTLKANGPRWHHRLVQAGGLLLLVILGFGLASGSLLALVGAWFPLFFIGLFTFARERIGPATMWDGRAEPGVAGALAVVLAGTVTGLEAAAFAALALFVIAAIALRLVQPMAKKV